MKVGFLGLGKLGLPCALAVESKGHTIYGYDTKDEVLSDRNVMPIGCVLKLEKKDV